MRRHLLTLTAAGMLAGGALPASALPIPEIPAGHREVARLRAHFDSVDAELRDASPAGLTAVQRSNRARLIGWLRQYRDAGVFPRNDRFEAPTPIFRDARGTLCAMAYLIERSGRGDLVDRVAATRNYAFIPDLADDPALVRWLDSAGLSVAEAARIQPSYPGDDVEAQVAQYDSAWNQRDTVAMNRLLAQNYQYFTSRGGVSSRGETLEMVSDPEYRLERAKRSEVMVSLSRPVAIVSSRWQGSGTYRGKPFEDDQRCGQTWMAVESGGWQLLSEHCVPIADGSQASP